MSVRAGVVSGAMLTPRHCYTTSTQTLLVVTISISIIITISITISITIIITIPHSPRFQLRELLLKRAVTAPTDTLAELLAHPRVDLSRCFTQ